jgi:hypothetical protein
MFGLKFGGNLLTETSTKTTVALSTREKYKILDRSVRNRNV